MTRNPDPLEAELDAIDNPVDIDALAADLAHLRVIGARLVELAQAPLFAHGVRPEALALGQLVEQLAGVTYRRLFDEDLPELDRRPA